LRIYFKKNTPIKHFLNSTDTSSMVYESDIDSYRTWWKRTRAVTQGYQKAYKAKTPAGDGLQVEFNFHEGLVKLQVEPSNDKGAAYTSTIKKGTIIRERDVLHGMNFPLKKKFLPYKVIFSCLPDQDILDCIGGVYEISKIPLFRYKISNSPDIGYELEPEKEIPRVPWFQRFLSNFKQPKESRDLFWEDLKKRAPDDINDSVMGFSMAAVLYFHFFDFVLLGWTLALLGFMFGGVDWVVRDRNPLILKILLFLSFGTYFFYTGYTRF
jgi:hypothetical protein